MSAKAKKKREKILLLPGHDGWEAWRGMNGGGLSLALRTTEHRALDVDGVPAGDLAMAFPVRDVSALPFRAPTSDEALFGDMASMHVERLGMRPGIDSGILNDYFKVGSRGEESLLLPVVLAPPPEGHLPKRSPQAFDISARCLPLPSEGVVMWRELGRWVFALAQEGQPLHFQALATNNLGEDAGREIKVTLSQLQIQGLIARAPKHCFVWIGDGEPAPLGDELEALGKGFGGTATVASKPAPVLPVRTSHLLPADVRAERVAKRKKQQTTLAVVAGVLVYVGLIGWAGWVLLEEKKKVAKIQGEYEQVAPLVEGINSHTQKWDELQPVTELKHWPVELMLNCSKARPDQGLRLVRAEVHNQLNITDQGGMELVRNIRLQGKADELDQVNTFNLNLKGSDDLRDYFWETPPAVEDTKSGRWGFIYDGRYDPESAANQ